MLLENKVAIVTGAGRGIGRAVALALGREGASVVVNDLGCERDGSGRDPKIAEAVVAELAALGAKAVASHHDVTQPAEVEALFSVARETYGQIDVVVTAAGILADKSLFDVSLEEWERVLRTDLTGTFLCTQAAARHLKKQRTGGAIVHCLSASGFLGNLGQVNESAAKAGVYGLMRTASIELQRYQVRVNAVAPLARTRLTEELPIFEKVSGTLEPEHIAPAVVFLASDLGKDLSGVVLNVAGGRISTFQLAESQGRLKEVENGVWTAAEIAEHFSGIARP